MIRNGKNVSNLIRKRGDVDGKVVVETDTAEVLTELYPGDRILRRSSIEAFKELESAPKARLSRKFITKSCQNWRSASYHPRNGLFSVSWYNLRYISNVAKYPNGRLITRKACKKDLNLPEITVKQAVLRLINEGLIIEPRTMEGKVFVVNPFVLSVGDKVSKTVYDLFRKSKWARW